MTVKTYQWLKIMEMQLEKTILSSNRETINIMKRCLLMQEASTASIYDLSFFLLTSNTLVLYSLSKFLSLCKFHCHDCASGKLYQPSPYILIHINNFTINLPL